MRIRFRKIVTPVQQNEHGEHWKLIQGADLVRDAGLLVERTVKVTVTPLVSNGNVAAALDIMVCDGSKWDEFVSFLRNNIKQTPVATETLEAFLHSFETKMDTIKT
jgi:hypothetical protein